MDKNIDEMIADARAEEQVAREQEKATKENSFKEELRGKIREALDLHDAIKDKTKVTVSLEEYITLNNKSMDLDRIINAIVSGLRLGYSKDKLRLYDEERVTETFRALYPEAYDAILALELEKHKDENEGE